MSHATTNESGGAAALPGGARPPTAGRNNWPVARAVLIFAGVMGAFYTLDYTQFASSATFQGYLAWIASTCSWILTQLGCDAQAADTLIDHTAGSFTVNIVRGCDALDPSAAFMAAVLASPVAFRRKVPGILVGILALMVINLIRIVSLFLVGVYRPEHFKIMHGEVWQAAFIVLAIAFWAVWVMWAGGSFRRLPSYIGAFGIFVAIFATLMYVWVELPVVSRSYATVFRGAGNTLFGSFGSAGRARFTEPEGYSMYDTIVSLRNLKSNGVRDLGGNSKITGFQPTAYIVALILATPVGWRRRWRALLWGVLLVNAYVLLRMFTMVTAQFLIEPGIRVADVGELGREIVLYFDWVVVRSFAGSFVLPLLIWFLVCFRKRQQTETLTPPAEPTATAPAE